MELTDRSQRVLEAVVQSYIQRPVPVGSRLVAKKYDFRLSPATIRNIMADLEDLGYLEQPHTSAGRIPTDKGYRMYVDALRASPNADKYEDDGDQFFRSLSDDFRDVREDMDSLLGEVTTRISSISHYLAFAIPLRPDNTTLNRVQLYRYRGNNTVAILMTNEGLVTNKVLYSDFGLDQKDLDRISDYLNSEFSGATIDDIRTAVVSQMSRERARAEALIGKAMQICNEALAFSGCDIIFSGFSELLGLPEFEDKVNVIMRAIEDRHKMVAILDGLGGGQEAQVLIGAENPDKQYEALSIITAEYSAGKRPLGRVGMIGPTRMDYSSAIPLVEVMARYISSTI